MPSFLRTFRASTTGSKRDHVAANVFLRRCVNFRTIDLADRLDPHFTAIAPGADCLELITRQDAAGMREVETTFAEGCRALDRAPFNLHHMYARVTRRARKDCWL